MAYSVKKQKHQLTSRKQFAVLLFVGSCQVLDKTNGGQDPSLDVT